MDFEVAYSLENEQQFWDELDDIVSPSSDSHDQIDNVLRNFIQFCATFKADYLADEAAVARCAITLLNSYVSTTHKDYVCRQLVYGLLQEDDLSTLHLVAAYLLHSGHEDDGTFEMMRDEGTFTRMVGLIQSVPMDEDGLRRLLLQLMYEMARIQQLDWEDLLAVDDRFILFLLQAIDQNTDDPSDPYQYSIIRVINGKLVLNEQYLVSSTSATARAAVDGKLPPTNRVIKVLTTHGGTCKTFGENLILLLNRESEISCQLLILKLLFLLFSSPATAEYFYTNDLYVLFDVILRNLLDLPSDGASASALRHTYLRVLHPLLANSQLSRPPHYKRSEARCVLQALLGESNDGSSHFGPADPTTLRLAKRCLDVAWLQLPDDTDQRAKSGSPEPAIPDMSHTAPTKNGFAQRLLGMNNPVAADSALSVVEVAAHTEKPGVQVPSRLKDRGTAVSSKKIEAIST